MYVVTARRYNRILDYILELEDADCVIDVDLLTLAAVEGIIGMEPRSYMDFVLCLSHAGRYTAASVIENVFPELVMALQKDFSVQHHETYFLQHSLVLTMVKYQRYSKTIRLIYEMDSCCH